MHFAGPTLLTLSMQSSIRGNGNESDLVTALTSQKSEQNLGVLSDITDGELQGLKLGLA